MQVILSDVLSWAANIKIGNTMQMKSVFELEAWYDLN